MLIDAATGDGLAVLGDPAGVADALGATSATAIVARVVGGLLLAGGLGGAAV